MRSASAVPAPSPAPSILSRAAGWLRNPTGRLLAACVVLPNILSLVALPLDIGLPPRTSAIFLYLAVALLWQMRPFPFVLAAFLAVLAYDLVSTIALLFGLAPSEIVTALRYAGIIRIYASPLYLSLLLAIGVTTVTAIALLRRRETLHQASSLVAVAAAVGLAAIDFALHTSPHYHFGSLMGRGRPVESAVDSSGFAQALANRRNVMLVIVEGMGELGDAAKRAAISEPLATDAIAARYRLTEGSIEYFGSTTAAEMREFCATRDGYRTLTAERGADCLPARLRRAGYETIAVHGFSGKMFDRASWYPLIGFDRALFVKELFAPGNRQCGPVFRGMCDADLGPALAQQIQQTNKPTFLYWLTLNTHIPVKLGEADSNFRCERIENAAEREVCGMSELWHDVFRAIAGIAANPALPPTEILIVGDHAPPLWSMHGRRMFTPGKVAWYRLTPR